MEKRNVVKMIDLTQFMLMESSGDSEAKSDLGTPSSSFPRPGRRFVADFDNYFGNYNDDDNDNDDDAESCSYGSSSHEDAFCHEYRDKENVHQHDGNDDGTSSDDDDNNHDDDEMEEDDAIDSKMVGVSKKCGGAFVMGDCSNSTKFLKNIEKENDKNFWETCLAS